jgi:hypothetical protein
MSISKRCCRCWRTCRDLSVDVIIAVARVCVRSFQAEYALSGCVTLVLLHDHHHTIEQSGGSLTRADPDIIVRSRASSTWSASIEGRRPRLVRVTTARPSSSRLYACDDACQGGVRCRI